MQISKIVHLSGYATPKPAERKQNSFCRRKKAFKNENKNNQQRKMRKRTRIYIMGDPLRWCLVSCCSPSIHHHITSQSHQRANHHHHHRTRCCSIKSGLQNNCFCFWWSGPCHPMPVQRRNRASGEILTTCVMAFLFQIPSSSSSIVSSRPIKADLRCWAWPPCLEMKKTSRRRPTESHHHNISSQVLTWIVV